MSYTPRDRATGELLADWAAIMRELRHRDVIRTNNNPVGDIAEAIVHGHYGGDRASFSQAGWDVRTPQGERIQVKAVRTTATTKRRNLSPIRDSDYDSVLVVVAYRRLNDRSPTPRGARAGSFQRVTPLDFDRATAFVEAVPRGRWTAYKDVAAAAGNAQGAQAIGEWLRRRGDEVPHAYRVLRADGFVADAFRPAGPGLPSDSASVRDLLRSEGVDVDPRGRASPAQRFSPEGWLQR